MPNDPNFMEIDGALAQYRYTQSDSQTMFLVRTEKTKNWMPLISARDSQKEVKRILGNFSLKKGYMAIVRGVSAVPTIWHLANMQKKMGGWIIVLEADETLAKTMKPKLPKNLKIISPISKIELQNYIESFPIEKLKGYRFLSLTSIRLAPEFYAEYEHYIKETFASRLSDLFTRLEFEPTWLKNALHQLKHFTRAKPAAATFGQFSGTAFLISTGPSLRMHLPWLKKNQNQLFLSCADSAWRVLHKAGITPDLIFTLDSQTFTYQHFAGLPLPQTGKAPALFADIVSNPKVIDIWKGSLYFSQTSHYLGDDRHVTPGCDVLEKEFFSDSVGTLPGDVQSGGSVATSLFDLLRQMGFQSIILLGQDLAYTHREIHCTGTHHTDKWLAKNVNRFSSLEQINNAVLKKRHISYEPSLIGKKVPADYILSLYAKWFSESAKTVPISIRNATFNGLNVANLERITLPAKSLNDNASSYGEKKSIENNNANAIDLEINLGSDFTKDKCLRDNATMKEKLRRFTNKNLLSSQDKVKIYIEKILNLSEQELQTEPLLSRIGYKYTIKQYRLEDSKEIEKLQEKVIQARKLFLEELENRKELLLPDINC